MPTHNHPLHAFDLRSVLLFTCLTMGGTSAILAQAERPQPTATDVFLRADTDLSGALSRQEAQALPSVAEHFEAWDTDGNGRLSLNEFLQHTSLQPVA